MRFNNLLSLSRTHARLAALLVAGALVVPMLYGCDSQQTSTDEGTAAQESTESATSDASSTDSASSDSDTDTEEETIEFNYSDGIDEDGRWSGVTALDYVTLPADYASIQAPASTVVPTDEEVQTQIDSILSDNSTTEQVTDQEVADGDTINIDYVGKIDGVEFDGGSTSGNGTTVTIGTTQYIDDFLEQLIGHKPGETFDIEVTFPDDYGVDDLNGKDATFTVTINYIQKTTTPELTDDWVAQTLKDTYGWSTVEEMRAGVKENLQYSNLATYVQDYVLNNSTVTEVPQAIVDYQGQQYLFQYQTYAQMYGTTLSALLQMYTGASTSEEFLTNNAEALENAARSYLVFQAIIEDAGLTETDEELEAYIASVSSTTDLATAEATYGKGYLVMRALLQKAGDYLIDHTTIVEDEAASDEASTTSADASEKDADEADDSSEKDASNKASDADESDSSSEKATASTTSKTTASETSSTTSEKDADEADDSASSKDADEADDSSKKDASESSTTSKTTASEKTSASSSK